MALTNRLKPLVDVPVWEWMRFAPVASSAISGLTTSGDGMHRYIYYASAATLYRYDTYTDGWQQLKAAFPVSTPASNMACQFKAHDGTYGYVISSTPTTITGPFLDGLQYVGARIRIINGTGDGQERTITGFVPAVGEPINVMDKFVVTAITNTSTTVFALTDSNKKWRINQWKHYQGRILLGSGQGTTIRKILYNNQDTLFFGDAKYHHIDPHLAYGHIWDNTIPIALSSIGRIESVTLTIDTPWTINPDCSSKFVLLTGGLWAIGYNTATPFYNFAYYDIAADVWYAKHSLNGLFPANNATDLCIERMGEFAGFYATGSIGAYTTRSITVASSSIGDFIPDNFAFAKLRLQNGQELTVGSNGIASVDVVKTFDATGSVGDTFWILPDNDKLYISGNSGSAIYQYSIKNDSMYMGPRYDCGIVTTGSVRYINNYDLIFPIQTISRNGNIAQVTTSFAHSFEDGDLITIEGSIGADAIYFNTSASKVTASGYDVTVTGSQASNTFTFPMSGTPSGISAAFATMSINTIVDPTKKWIQNEHVGRTLQTWDSTGGPFCTTAQYRYIIANTSQSIIVGTAFSTAPINGLWGYNIISGRAFGGSTNLGTGSMQLSGSTRSGLPYVYLTGSLTGTASFMIGASITGSGIPTGSYIRGFDDHGLLGVNAPVTISLSQNALSSTTGIYTSSLSMAVGWGLATGGSTTTLMDATKVWYPNLWIGSRLKFTGGTNVGFETTITSNIPSQLTFAPAAGSAVDATSQYSIIPISARGLGHQMCWYGESSGSKAGKYMYSFRGGVTMHVDRYNINKHEWESYYPGPLAVETLTTGTMFAYDGTDRIYFTKDSTGRVYYLDLDTNKIQLYGMIPYGMSTAIMGNRMVVCSTSEGTKFLYIMRHTGTEFWRSLIVT